MERELSLIISVARVLTVDWRIRLCASRSRAARLRVKKMKQEIEAHAARLHHGQGRRREDTSEDTPPSPGMQLKDIIISRDATDSAAGADGPLCLNLTLPPTQGTLGLRFDPDKTQAPQQTPPTQRAFEAPRSQSSLRSLSSLHSLPSASAFARGKRLASKDQTQDPGVYISPAAEGGAMTATMMPSGLFDRTFSGRGQKEGQARRIGNHGHHKKERHVSQLRMEAKALQEEIRAPDASGAKGRPLRRMSIKEYDALIGKYSPDIDAGAASSESDGTKGGVESRSQPEAQHDCKWTGVKPPCVDYVDAFKRKPGFCAYITRITVIREAVIRDEEKLLFVCLAFSHCERTTEAIKWLSNIHIMTAPCACACITLCLRSTSIRAYLC